MMNTYLLRIRRKNNDGFTLVELMIVVAIIGVLAALAIYGVSRYLKHSKTAEATRSLAAIETGSKAKYQNETIVTPATGETDHLFCGVMAEDTGTDQPAAIPKAQKIAVVTTATTGYGEGLWKCLKFSLNAPQFYQYHYEGSGKGSTADAAYKATAAGDLDGNSVSSLYTILGKVVDGEATRNGAMTIVNEDE